MHMNTIKTPTLYIFLDFDGVLHHLFSWDARQPEHGSKHGSLRPPNLVAQR